MGGLPPPWPSPPRAVALPPPGFGQEGGGRAVGVGRGSALFASSLPHLCDGRVDRVTEVQHPPVGRGGWRRRGAYVTAFGLHPPCVSPRIVTELRIAQKP